MSSQNARRTFLIGCLALLVATSGIAATTQRRGGGHPAPMPPGHFAARRHTVFVGGYFYDPHFGPYPWWAPGLYPYWDWPGYGAPGIVRVLATPKDAAVYVDGFYAGIVDDFDGMFQSLPLPPGGHNIVLYAAGYRTVSERVYLSPGSTFKMHETMERLPAGAVSEPPVVAAPVPPPPSDSFVSPVTPPRSQPLPSSSEAGAMPKTGGYGSLALQIQPPSAVVTVDGERWASADGHQFVIHIAVGSHRVEVVKPGYQPFSTEIQVHEGQTTPLNVVLSQARTD